jgi:16S rRNA C967 or C1407 C5-methylase (RsmB/RsmF family)/NOL1/NOP2/fmu family ribosome biogenesis protein
LKIPVELLNSLHGVNGFNPGRFEQVHAAGGQVTSIRLNMKKLAAAPLALETCRGLFGCGDQLVPWSDAGCYLAQRPSFTIDPLFHAGAYYVQEASSMFLGEVFKQLVELTRPVKVLDLCAAPGGKSVLIQSLISPESLLVSNEVIRTRVNPLAENITKWGASNVIVTNNDPRDFRRLACFFDVVVIDAPCSGSGLFRKDPAAVNEWSLDNVALCSRRQQRIIEDVLPSLRPGGLLIYSTCSFSKEEDEDIADRLVHDHGLLPARVALKEEWNIVESTSAANAHGYRFFPDRLKGEGFFIAAFIKPKNEFTEPGSVRKPRSRSAGLTPKEIELLKPWLREPEQLSYIKQEERVIAIPPQLQVDLGEIQSALYIKKAGVELGTIIRNELIPSHELAVSTMISDTVPRVNVDREMALQYLRKQEPVLRSNIMGWALISYAQLPLGWIKLLVNRVNNYYPREWRILNK